MSSYKCYTKETIKYCETWEKKGKKIQWGSKTEVTRWKKDVYGKKKWKHKRDRIIEDLFFSVYKQKKNNRAQSRETLVNVWIVNS